MNQAVDSGSLILGSSPRPLQEPQQLLHVPQRGSVQLRAPSAIRRLEVENPRICEPLQSAPGEIAIVGKQQGETRLAVWMVGEAEPNYWCVRVSGDAEQMSARDDAALRRMVTELYPQSRVRLVMEDDRIYVQGQAKDRQEAIQILSFVGSIRLVPIVDQLIVSRR
jgi:Flp pilus assembly secretin CpaC